MPHKNHIDHLFSDSLRNLNVEPAPENWDAISRKMKSKKRRIFPFWWTIAASFMLFFGVGTYLLSPFNNLNIKNHFPIDPSPARSNSVTSKDDFLPKKKSDSVSKFNDSKMYKIYILNQSAQKEAAGNDFDSKNKRTKTNKHSLETTYKNDPFSTRNALTENIETSAFIKKETLNLSMISSENGSGTLNVSAVSFKNMPTVVPYEFSKAIAKMYPRAALNKLAVASDGLKTKNERLANRWWIGPVMAPLMASSIGNDSPIDPKFSANSKQFKSVTSYGIQLQYAVSKQFAIRSGVQSIALEYTTNDIVFWEGYQNTRLENVNTSDHLYIQIESGLTNDQAFNKSSNNGINGQLHQRSSYVEWPIEGIMQWKLNRWFFECSGGLSTLFLQENRIYLTSTGFSMTVGEASNLSRVHYSANLGLGAGFYLKNDLSLSISPSFKYQLSTYNSNSGNFSPYVLGMYGGVKYRF